MQNRNLVAALMFAGTLAAPAHAADVVAPEPLPAPEMVAAAPGNDWSGFYLGALVGYSWGEADIGSVGIRDVDADGVDGGFYGGVDWQVGNFVLGLEADLLASGLDGSEKRLDIDQGLNGSLRARAGIALDRFLLYGTAGGAATELEVSRNGNGDDAALLGWTAGAGAEAKVTDSITARIEYRYTEFEDKTFTLGGKDVDSDFATRSLRAGVGVHF